LVGLATGTVYSQSTGPHALDIVIPGHITSAPDMLAFIYLNDANGYPVRAPAGGIDVRLVGGGLVETVRGTTIPYNASSAPIPLRVSGDGYVSAAAPGLRGDREHITYDRDGIRVKLQVAPDIVLPGGRVHYTVWLERDASASDSLEERTFRGLAGGADTPALPYHPARAIAAELQTTDTDVLRLTEHIPPSKKEGDSAAITLHGGRASGVLYAGHATATPTVPTASSLR
ncbi:MAG: hypothetical protein J4F28_09635, partial [Nitrosopumilaceae archaeon]|nr:hypothetical protein [Nitrosopumilaceae archaeon]